MSVDDRVRMGLTANAAQLRDPDIEARLEMTLRRHRRREVGRWAAVVAVAAALCAAVALTQLRDPEPPPVPADTTRTQPLLGRYAGLVAPLPGPPNVSGRWVLSFGETGQLTVTAPPRYTGDTLGSQGKVEDHRIETTLFTKDLCPGQPAGSYTVQPRGDNVTIAVLDDPCTARTTILTRTRWVSTAATAYTGPRIPEGSWSREVTVAQMNAAGLHPAKSWLSDNGFDDGKGKFIIEFAGDRWFIFVETNQKALEIGDQGAIAYDALGRWVQAGVLAIEWSVTDDTLTTHDVARLDGALPDPGENAVLSGTWRKTR
jgi:hypothetical protein